MSGGMRKLLIFTLSLVLVLSCFTACDSETVEGEVPKTSQESGVMSSVENSSSESSAAQSGLDINVDEQQAIKDAFYQDNGEGSDPVWAGVQVYNGEVVNIWRKMNGSNDLQKAQDIYLYDSNDNGMVIVSGVPSSCIGSWFYTYEGYCLSVQGGMLMCFDADGTEKFNISAEGGISGIVQSGDGTIVLLMKEADNSYCLAILDLEKAEYTKVPNLDLGKERRLFISAGENGVVLLNKNGFFDVNLETGELSERMALTEYGFELDYTMKTFRMQEDGMVELLYQQESKVLFPTDIEKYRTVIRLQIDSIYAMYTELQQLVSNFNAANSTYYVYLVSYGRDRTVEEILEAVMEGEGGDLILSNGITWNYYVDLAIAQGAFEDLSPYMETSGIYEGDYFSSTFEKFKTNGGTYGICYGAGVSGFTYKKEVLGNRDIGNLEDLLDTLQAYTGMAVYNAPADTMLWDLLRASDSLAGTVDWDNLTCDFQGDLFAKLLEVCKLYGNDDYLNSDKNMEMNHFISTNQFYGYLNKEQRELAGDEYLGFFFDEGCYPGQDIYHTLHINSRSENKEGAWAFLAWLLSEEAQSQKNFTQNRITRFVPANVFAFEEVIRMEINETALAWVPGKDGKEKYLKYIPADADYEQRSKIRKMTDEAYRGLYNLKEQDAEEIREQLYIAKPMPARTVPIQNIIYQEAALYFNDERSLGDTCDAIQKKVQEYLDGLK